jgi:hypothetical protein
MSITLRVLSLGAGVQSTTLALMAAHGEIEPMPDIAIFADTQAEPAAVYEHLNWLMGPDVLPFPVAIVTAGSLLDDLYDPRGGKTGGARPPCFVVTDAGNAGPLQRQCTQKYKIDPIRRKVRQLLGIEPGRRGPKTPIVEQWIGISTDEAQRMKPARESYIINRWPLIEKRINRWDCLLWLDRHGYRRPAKSACTFCPYRDDAGWREMRETAPADWAQAVEVDAHIRHAMPRMKKSQAFIHRSLVPLSQIDLRNAYERGQPDLFGNECEGMCGV